MGRNETSQYSGDDEFADQAELALYADPLTGCMAFCPSVPRAARRRQQKQEENLRKKSAPALEPTRNSLALMQTVVMSFARGLNLGKPELPIDHAHVYFPVQIVHKVIAQCEALKLTVRKARF